jgi:hypothetical protein
MQDVAGKQLSVGQRVATTVSGYEELQVGTVYGFSPKKVKIMLQEDDEEILRLPYQVAIIE